MINKQKTKFQRKLSKDGLFQVYERQDILGFSGVLEMKKTKIV